MSTNQTAIAILQYGKLLHDEERRYCQGPDQSRLQQAERELICRLRQDRSDSLNQIFAVNAWTPVDPVTLRVLSLVAYLSLCTNRPGIGLSEVVMAVGGTDPAAVLDARQAVSRLLIGRQLVLKNGHGVELGKPLLDYLAGGENAPPLAPTQGDLENAWRKREAEEKSQRASAPVSFKSFPTPRQLAERMARDVIGLEAEVRAVACRVAMHLRRAAMIGAGKDPGAPNEALLFVGPSGTGKTWVAETAGRVCGLPFGAISSTDLTCEGYIGMSADDAVKQVVIAADNDVQRARYGICFFDEWDKKRSSGWEHGSPDIGGAAVQQSVLRLVEGCEFQVGGRRGGYDRVPTMIDTHGMFFVFAGTFNGLDEIIGKRRVSRIGFGASERGVNGDPFFYDALQDYGLIPEFVNRLSGIVVFPEPTIEQLREIATRSVIPSFNRLLAAFGARIELELDTTRLIAECASETQTRARGIKSIIAKLTEDVVFEMRPGAIRLDFAAVLRTISDMGMR